MAGYPIYRCRSLRSCRGRSPLHQAHIRLAGEVSGATRMMPFFAEARQYSPFSITLACVQVRPDRYPIIGKRAPGA